MRLEVGHIFIKDIQFGTESKIEDGVLYVSEEAVKEVVLEDEHIKSVKFDIARPGESVRITPVKDVIEPRVKVEGRGGVFPGVISKVDTVGEGKTYALKGMAVVTLRHCPRARFATLRQVLAASSFFAIIGYITLAYWRGNHARWETNRYARSYLRCRTRPYERMRVRRRVGARHRRCRWHQGRVALQAL